MPRPHRMYGGYKPDRAWIDLEFLDDQDPVGTVEIGRMFGVQTDSVRQWGKRGQFPPPDGYVSYTPWWRLGTVKAWADENRRRYRL